MDHINNMCPQSMEGNSALVFLNLIQTLMATQCGLESQYPNIYTEKLKDGEKFDYIVVGAGSAGSIVASRLSENENMRVLLLEAGKIPSVTSEIPYLTRSLWNSTESWNYFTEPSSTSCISSPNHQCTYPRGKALGGSSTINGMVYLRGHRQDYDDWGVNNPGWDHDSVQKYFKKVEKVTPPQYKPTHGTNGNIPLNLIPSKHPIRQILINAAGELGDNYSAKETHKGYFDALNNIDKGTRVSTAKAYLSKNLNRKNLFIATDVLVASVVFSTRNNKLTATGVKVKIGNKIITLIATNEVILSAGAVNSPQILMNSGIGPQKHLRSLGITVVKDLPVGENLQDHIAFSSHEITLNETLVYPYDFVDEAYNFWKRKDGLYASVDMLNFIGFVNTQRNSEYPDIEFQNVLTRVLDPVTGREVVTFAFRFVLSKPKSTGWILLNSNNPFDKPRIIPNYLSVRSDIDTLIRAAHYAISFNGTQTFRRNNIKFSRIDVSECMSLVGDDYFECVVRHTGSSAFHPVGTCKMGPSSDKSSVVDANLRVHGVENLRVIDASVMPTIPSVNTNAATMMIGEKGADLIKETWNHCH